MPLLHSGHERGLDDRGQVTTTHMAVEPPRALPALKVALALFAEVWGTVWYSQSTELWGTGPAVSQARVVFTTRHDTKAHPKDRRVGDR